MLPGKSYSPEDVVHVVIRRWWLIVIPCALGMLTAVFVSARIPDTYRSETLIMLVPPRVPESYVKLTVTPERVEDRLSTVADEILSRSSLERIILDMNLYPDLRRTLPMEAVVQRMRKDITITIENTQSFRVSYVNRGAVTAQHATERLASLFIEENRRDRENVAEDTNAFLDSQLEDARERLVEHEKKLERYRSEHGNELPSQAPANLQAIQNAQGQLQALADATDRARERRLLLERQLADFQSDPVGIAGIAEPDSVTGISVGESTAVQLEAAEEKLQQLLQHDKPEHPDVKAAQRAIRDLQARLKTEQERLDGGGARKPASPTEALRDRRMRDLQAQIRDVDRQIAEKQEQERRLRAAIADYQARLASGPKRESDLVELTRDYATLQTTYQNLLTKRQESKIAANLEGKRIGEQYKVLDPARVPVRPFSPNRPLIDLAGAAAGLAFGGLLTAWSEYRDSSFRREDEVTRLLGVRVLAVVPLIESAEERRIRRRRTAIIGIAAVVLIGGSAALALVGVF